MVNHDEKQVPAELQTALAALIESKPDKALEVLKNTPDTVDARMIRMSAHMNKGEFSRAAAVALPEDEENAAIQKLLAYCSAGMSDGEGMRLYLNRAWALGLDSREIFDAYADILRRSGHPHEADYLSVHVPGIKASVAERMLFFMRQGEMKQAIAVSDHYPFDASDSIQVLLQRRLALMILGETKEADNIGTKLAEIMDPDFQPLSKTMDAIAEMLTGKPEAAAENLEFLQELPVFALIRIQALKDAGRIEEALSLASGLKIEDLAPREKLLLCKLLLDMGDAQGATAIEYEKYLTAGSDDHFRFRYFHAKALLNTPEKKHGVMELEKLIQDCKATYIADSRRSNLCILQCMCHRDLGQDQKAQEIHRFLKLLYPGDKRVDMLLNPNAG